MVYVAAGLDPSRDAQAAAAVVLENIVAAMHAEELRQAVSDRGRRQQQRGRGLHHEAITEELADVPQPWPVLLALDEHDVAGAAAQDSPHNVRFDVP